MRVLIAIFFFISFFVNAQNFKTIPDAFNGQCKTSFIEDVNRGVISLESLPSNNDMFWVVYSDRAENRLKNRADGSNNGITLAYIEALYVKQVKGNWLHVYGFEDENEKGWIQARYLLLSNYSLKTEGTISIPRKAIILTSLDEMVVGGVEVDDVLDQKHYYNQPIVSEDAKLGTPSSFTVMFIMKEQDGSVLLANTDILNGNPTINISKVYGWIPRVNIIDWDSRVALEPARSADAISEYSVKKLPGYKNLNKLKSCIDYNYCNNGFFEFEIGDIRINQFRYPLVRSIDNNIKEVFIIISANKNFEEIPITHPKPYIMNEFNISHQEAIDLLNETRVTTKAYVALDYNGNGINALEPVVLLTEQEYLSLVRSLRKLTYECVTSSEKKKCLQENLITVCKSILGPKISTEIIEALTLNQIWNLIFGENYYFKPLKNIQLSDIKGGLKKKDFMKFYSEFELKVLDFCDKRYDSRRFSLNGSYFYWIPLDDLPGCKIK